MSAFRLVVIVPSPLLGPVMEQLQGHADVQVVEQELMIAEKQQKKVKTPKQTLAAFMTERLSKVMPGIEFHVTNLLTIPARQAGYGQSSISSLISQWTKTGKLVRIGPRQYKRPEPLIPAG